MVANVTRYSMADRTATANRIRRHDADEWRLLQKSNFQVELVRTVFRWDVTVTRPHDILDIKSILFPRVPMANLKTKQNKLIIIYQTTKANN